MTAASVSFDPSVVIPQLSERLDGIRTSRNELDEELMMAELSLNEFLGAMDAVEQRLKRIKTEPRQAAVAPLPPAAPAPIAMPVAMPSLSSAPAGMTLEEFKASMGTILQGSLDAVSNKLSDKIAGMLKDLQLLSGPAREMKFQELKQAAEYESIDFSSLYGHQEKLTSNLGEVGVEEKESKGIDSSLERLRKMRGLKPKA